MFELFKARMEAKKARREAIVAIDKYINALSITLPSIKDEDLKTKTIDTMTKLVSLKEVYKRNTELPKWASEVISTALKILTLVAGTVALEITTNRGTGDKFTNNLFDKVTRI